MARCGGTAYDLSGPAAAPVVVLIHGLGLRRQTWDAYIAPLSAHFRVLSYDLAGHGGSVPPATRPSLMQYAAELATLLDALGIDRAALVGFSLGGMINRRFAMDYPARVTALGVLNSPHEREPAAQKLVEAQATDSTAGPHATLDAAIARWFTPEFIAANPDYVAMIRDWVLANDTQVYAECRQVLAAGVTELIRPSPPITHPALVMTCEHDRGSSPMMSHAIASEIAGAEAMIIPDLKHMGLVERPDLFLPPLLQFLKQHAR